MSDDSETFFIRFRVIDTTSDQNLRSIAQKLRSTAPLEVLRKVLHVHCAMRMRDAHNVRIVIKPFLFDFSILTIDTTSDQDLRSITQNLIRPTDCLRRSKLVDELSGAIDKLN